MLVRICWFFEQFIISRHVQEHSVGGQSLANRSQRFSELPVTSGITPGPGRYNLSKKTDWIKTPAKPAITVVPPSVSHCINLGVLV